MTKCNYVKRMPENKYKRIELSEDMEVTGYKSMTCDYDPEKCPQGKLNNDKISLSIKTIGKEPSFSSFSLDIEGRELLLKLREVIDFALEIDKEETDGR
jgi:hypothetical protein